MSEKSGLTTQLTDKAAVTVARPEGLLKLNVWVPDTLDRIEAVVFPSAPVTDPGPVIVLIFVSLSPTVRFGIGLS
jgi:hypothetical protein